MNVDEKVQTSICHFANQLICDYIRIFVSVSLAAVAAADVERYKQVRALFLESGDGVQNVAANNCSLSPEAPCFVEQNYKGKQSVAPVEQQNGQSV